MNNPSAALLSQLVPAIEAATGLPVYTRIPKDVASYPYVYISDVYTEENGTKNMFFYRLDVLIQVVYSGLTTITPLLTASDGVMTVINNGIPFSLSAPFELMDCTLNSSTMTEYQTPTGMVNIVAIRAYFNIKQAIDN